MLFVCRMWTVGLRTWKTVGCFKWGLIGCPSRSMGDSGAEIKVDYGGHAQEFSEEKIIKCLETILVIFCQKKKKRKEKRRKEKKWLLFALSEKSA